MEKTMKKAIVLAAAVAAASSANAAWVTGAPGETHAGELMLTVWNSNTEKAFSQDMGILTSDALTGRLGNELTIDMDTAGLAWVGGDLSDLSWSVVGASGRVLIEDGTPNFGTMGFYMTSSSGAPSPMPTWTVPGNGGLYTKFQDYDNKLGNPSQSADENPVVLTEGTLTYAGSGVWGPTSDSLADAFYIGSNAASDMASMGAYGFTFSDPNTSKLVVDAGVWKMDATSGALTYTAVPVPAAAWLFGSALLSLATVGRRRNVK